MGNPNPPAAPEIKPSAALENKPPAAPDNKPPAALQSAPTSLESFKRVKFHLVCLQALLHNYAIVIFIGIHIACIMSFPQGVAEDCLETICK